jgi:hypothetical protein
MLEAFQGGILMVSLKLLQSVGYTTKFFKLPQSSGTYYTFDNSIPSRQPSYWNIVGINQQKEGKEPCIDVQILYIPEEALRYKPFSALQGASSFLSLGFDELQAFLHFLEETFDWEDLSVEEKLIRFSLMDEQELAELHFGKGEIRRYLGHYYRYDPLPHIQTSDKMSVICFPSWIFERKFHPSSTLLFATFDRERLKDPAFQIPGGKWLGFMRFDLRALSEFFFLLKQREKTTLDYLG